MQKHLDKLKDLLKFGAAAILLAIPLYPKFPFIKVPGTYVSIRLEDFLIGFVVVVALFIVYFQGKEILSGRVGRGIVIFLLTSFVSLLSAIFLTHSVVFYIGLLHWVRRLQYFAPFFVGLILFKNRNRELLEFFLKCLMIVVFIAFIYGLGQKHLDWPVIITQNQEYSKGIALRYVPGSHINSTFAGHYDLASFLLLVLPLFITLFFLIKERVSRIVLAIVVFSGLWLLVNSISRISIVSYFLSTCVALFLARKYKAIAFVLVISLVFFGFSSDLRARYDKFFDVVSKKIQTNKILYDFPTKTAFAQDEILRRTKSQTPKPAPTMVFEDRSTSIRLNVEWPRAIRAFSKNPLLGTGFSSITLATDNDYLRLLGEVGILGFLSFVLIFVSIIALLYKQFPLYKNFEKIELGFVSGMSGSLVGVLINAFFIDVFEASKFAIIFWMLIGFYVAMMKMDIND